MRTPGAGGPHVPSKYEKERRTSSEHSSVYGTEDAITEAEITVDHDAA
jgi:hypothetical protein